MHTIERYGAADRVIQHIVVQPFPAWLLLMFGMLAALMLLYYARYIGIGRGKAFLLWLGSVVVGAVVVGSRYPPFRPWSPYPDAYSATMGLSGIVSAGLLVVLVVAFVAKLYLKWLCGKATEKERAAGTAGVRVWLGGGNLIWCLLIALCAWHGFGYSFWAVLVLTVGAVVAYPLFNMLSHPGTQPAPYKEDLSREREKVLNLLEAGKVTPEESAELLSALGESTASSKPRTVPMTAGRKLLLGGAALVLVGFFLPWYRVNPGQELNRLAGGLQRQMQDWTSRSWGPNQALPAPPALANAPRIQTGTYSVSGANVADKLGWVVLLLAAAAAVLPYVAAGLKSSAQHALTLVALGVGAVILVYLLTQSIRHVSVGLLVALAGYLLQFVGALRERRAAVAG